MKKLSMYLFFFLAIFSGQLLAQYPTDYLGKDFHKERRQALREKMPPNSVAVMFANPVRNRANDVEYVYHQDPDFYYLTGYQEPHSLVLIFKEKQKDSQGNTFSEVLFTQQRQARKEMYNGARLGVEGAKRELGFEAAYDATEFKNFNMDFSVFDKIMFLNLPSDVRDAPGDEADLYSLLLQFKNKVDYPVDFNADKYKMYDYVKSEEFLKNPQAAQILRQLVNSFPDFASNDQIKAVLEAKSPEQRKLMIEKLPEPRQKLDGSSLEKYMTDLREVKSAEEIALLRMAVDVSCVAQAEVYKAMRPGMSESEVQGIHEFVFKKYGAEDLGYPSIVGAGNNGCTLHYISNNKMDIKSDLVLMDLGAQYRGYTADITRTIPASGKFTKEQRAIYELVLKAQEAAFARSKPGNKISDNTLVCRQVINQGLAELGIIESVDAPHNYFPHGVSHHIGLDVHDRGNYQEFKENMVLTVEPGIYIPEGSPCDKRWWGIAVRIEDDILITKDGYELLSTRAPRTPDEIEKLMAEESIFSNYKLPDLKK
ncbi:aminopeptidase P N-terminal domain-containing protein [Imperialibacter roseus]|uniref:Xaa-Pro aminopeptidase n=1 Tax=Imperialibacter roseus TaxID=1324217 RepID=A0ABZ0IPX1_9BACT|nr:aminopeptidase P N-terminal domain-containing protein [Imperialibacter roseus]WOK06040.1 aminopeptidase P N-terminal domain-containing protein [Imperialibacter roseus]